MAESKSPKRRAPRRRSALSEKRRFVELTLCREVSIREIAREQGVNPTSVCDWRTLYHAGKLGEPRARSASPATFLPVTIASAERAPVPVASSRAAGARVVQLMLSSGATLRIETGALDAALMRALVAELRR
jgi:transposase-like protein